MTPKEHIEVGSKLDALAIDQSEWSQATFGTDDERGPVGAMIHLAMEAAEAKVAWQAGYQDGVLIHAELFHEELADCFLLILDASRRGGMTPLQLICVAQEKMKVLRTRTYLKPTGDVPSEHIRHPKV